ncbi:hypothetical protein FA15DRAFT_661343, partial [Coprinopsis marcescibilis]
MSWSITKGRINEARRTCFDRQMDPPDNELYDALMECVKLKYTRKEKIRYLEKKFNLTIGETKLAALQKRLEIPTTRSPRIAKEAIVQVALDFIAKDTTQGSGPAAVKAMLHNEFILIPCDDVRSLMKEVVPDGFAKRAPGYKGGIVRGQLMSAGPLREVNCDGHEKLGNMALRMGDIGLPIYGYRDKWSGYILKLIVIPDARKAAPMAHIYLDLIAELGGVPVQLTTDKGPERVWQHSIQDALRRAFADIDPDIIPTGVAMKSIRNIIIEALWQWFQKTTGKNLKDVILQGQEKHIFRPQCPYHTSLFYWVFVPLVQQALDNFRDYWNYHRVRKQKNKLMPSGHIPADAFFNPEKYDIHAKNYLIPMPEEMQALTRAHIEPE